MPKRRMTPARRRQIRDWQMAGVKARAQSGFKRQSAGIHTFEDYTIRHTHVTQRGRLRQQKTGAIGTTWETRFRNKSLGMRYSLEKAKELAANHYSEIKGRRIR